MSYDTQYDSSAAAGRPESVIEGDLLSLRKSVNSLRDIAEGVRDRMGAVLAIPPQVPQSTPNEKVTAIESQKCQLSMELRSINNMLIECRQVLETILNHSQL